MHIYIYVHTRVHMHTYVIRLQLEITVGTDAKREKCKWTPTLKDATSDEPT